MLQALRIRNFAIIDSLELDFSQGFTVITGETGSGKSILLNALNLLLGDRSNTSLIGFNGDKAIVEAEFLIENFTLMSFFSYNDLDYETKTLIRREINKNGKSRAFINDTPVNLNLLRDLTSQLVNIHSQYNTLELKEKKFQLEILDTLANLNDDKNSYQKLYAAFKNKQLQLNTKEEEFINLSAKKDYISFQLEELNALKLNETDFNAIEEKIKFLENRENILNVLQQLVNTIDEEPGIIPALSQIKNKLIKESDGDKKLFQFSEILSSSIIELKELSVEASTYMGNLDSNNGNIEEYIQKIDAYQHCLRKHNAQSQEQLIETWNTFSKEIIDAESLSVELENLHREISKIKEELTSKALDLHSKRLDAASRIEGEVQLLLKELKMTNTQLIFNLNTAQEFNSFGLTEIKMLFSANQGIDPVPIEKAASGGELSRVMLSLQKLLAHKKQLPTVLFDEIDTGVSGEVAHKIGLLLQDMGQNLQLIAITHLPQVAARAKHHFKVLKHQNNEKTNVEVSFLDTNSRISEVARLMSGEIITDAAIENAKHLMA
jgi:DNA repair protein RecN (Recombination protein N)